MPLFDAHMLKDTLEKRVLDVTRRYQEAGYFPTASVRVFDREKTLAAIQVGEADENSVFDVASLTKIATATQVLMLINQGRVSLDAPIGTYFKEIENDPFLRVRLKDITIFRLMTHTSGIVDWYPFYIQKGQDFFTVFKSALLKCPPSVGMSYSDLNFMLLGKLLERLNGMPLETCLTENLVKPLSLGLMTYRPGPSLPIVPSGYGNPNEMDMCRTRGQVFNKFCALSEPIRVRTHDGNAHYYFDEVAGHAGIFAVPQAYEALCRFYMNTDIPVMLEAQKEQKGTPTRGLGFQTGAMYPFGCGHTGFTGTEIWFSREKNIGVVAFTNRLFYPDQVNQHLTNDYRRAVNETVLTLAQTLR